MRTQLDAKCSCTLREVESAWCCSSQLWRLCLPGKEVTIKCGHIAPTFPARAAPISVFQIFQRIRTRKPLACLLRLTSLSSSQIYRGRLIMKRTISIALGTLALISAVTFGGFTTSANASARDNKNQDANSRHHRHHRKHHGRRTPGAASLRKRSW
jgi:hypothetical protein